jgi:hypothetical protein
LKNGEIFFDINLHNSKIMLTFALQLETIKIMKKPIVTLKTNRDYYSAKECAENSMSVGEFMDMLSNYPSDAKIVFSNDNGYTYGVVGNIAIKVN